MTQQQDFDIDIHVPTNEQLPSQLFRRYDNLLKYVHPMVASALVIIGVCALQLLGASIKIYFLTKIMVWALLLIAIAVALAALLPTKYRLFYLAGLFFSVAVGLLW